jgi:small subunit ribosomal protein S1
METNNAIGSESPESKEIETGGQESFAELLEKSSTRKARLFPGQRVKAKVVGITSEIVYIDLGGKSEGVIDVDEFKDENGAVSIREGDMIEAAFVSVVDGAMKMSTLVHGHSTLKLTRLREASESGAAVTGEVRREIKGGFEVNIDGIRCFCPFSQIDLKRGREGGLYVGRNFDFRILEFKENGRTIVLSRRAILQEEKKAVVEKLKESLQVGMEITGAISSIQKFGAFVDIGGIEGLIPSSELSWSKSDRAENMLAAGQEVRVKLISIDWEKNRLTLSLKAMQPDPWKNIMEKYPVGSKITGPVVRLTNFGAFVNIEPGIDGLIHISNLGAGKRINHPKEVVETGSQVEAYVLAVDQQSNKISLSIEPKAPPRKINFPAPDVLIDGVVEKVMPFGVFVKINNDLNGLVPNSEMGTPRGTDHSKTFQPGTPMKVLVLDVDTEQGKVTLSRKAIIQKEEEADLRRFRETEAKETKSENGLSDFGELLRAKLEEKGIRN